MGGFAWVTLATNDSYSLGALVLGHALKQTGTIGQLVILVTPGVTPPMRAKLSAVFNVVQEVNILDSKDEKNLRLLKRPELGVTFTKLHCWHLTQFDKCVFLDADTLILSNCDELFQRDELSAAPDVGWPDCFNSGVFVFKPNNETYESLVKFALENGSFDGGDQGLLNLFFSDWAHKDISKRLPFIYNMCSVASYSYLPAFKQFGGQVKIVHFIGITKPWLHYFDTELKQVQPSSGTEHLKEHLQLWWNIFCAQVHPVLTPDMFSAAQKNSSDKRPNQSTSPINTSSDNRFTYPVVIPDPWLSYQKTDLDKSDQYKPDESHNTNSHNNEQVFDGESLQQMTYTNNSTKVLDDVTDNDRTDINDLKSTTDIDLQSAIVITEEFNVNTPTKAINKSLDDHISLPGTNTLTATLLPSSSGETITEDKPELLQDSNKEEGLASAFAQFTLGSRRSETQSALEDQLRRQCWEVGNIDYLGRDSFSNIWNKISETMAASQSETERKEEQITAQTNFASIAPPKLNSESEIAVCKKPDTQQQHADPNLKQAQAKPNLKQTEYYSEGPPVTLKDILLPTQRTASPELVPICVKTSALFPVSDEIKVPICETKLAESEVIPICEAKPAEIKSPVCLTEPSESANLGTSEENNENPNVILTDIGPVLAAPICEKNNTDPETSAPICQKLETVCRKVVTDPIYVKPETICEKTTESTEKPASIPEQNLAPTIDLVLTATSSPVLQSAVSNNNVAALTTSVVAALPLAPSEKEESTSATSIETSLKPIHTAEPIIASPRISNVPVQCQETAQDKLEECSPTVTQFAASVSTEKQQESKTEVPTSPLPTQDSNTKNNKHNKKNNKNGNQDGKLQQQHCKSEKGKNIKSKPTGDVPLATMKTEEKSINPVPISELPSQEPEVKPTAAFGAVTEKVEDGKKDSTFPMPTELKSNEKTAKVRDDIIMQDSKSKKNDKQKKDHDHGDAKCKEPQKSENEFNNQDKKKGTDKQEKNDGKKEIVQKPEQQSQNKNSKKNNNNKGDSKTKKDGDQKSNEKVEQKSEIKPKHEEEIKLEPKVECKPEPAPETKPITKSETKSEQKAEVKKPDEKVESKSQQKPENSGKPGKDTKSDDKKKGGKEHKSQAAPSSKEKGKGQSLAHKQEAKVLTPMPTAPFTASAATPAPDALPVAPVSVAPPVAPAAATPATTLVSATPPLASMPAAPTSRPAVEQTPIAPSEKPSSQAQQKESCSNEKKEAAPTPPPRKGNNVAKRGKKK